MCTIATWFLVRYLWLSMNLPLKLNPKHITKISQTNKQMLESLGLKILDFTNYTTGRKHSHTKKFLYATTYKDHRCNIILENSPDFTPDIKGEVILFHRKKLKLGFLYSFNSNVVNDLAYRDMSMTQMELEDKHQKLYAKDEGKIENLFGNPQISNLVGACSDIALKLENGSFFLRDNSASLGGGRIISFNKEDLEKMCELSEILESISQSTEA